MVKKLEPLLSASLLVWIIWIICACLRCMCDDVYAFVSLLVLEGFKLRLRSFREELVGLEGLSFMDRFE